MNIANIGPNSYCPNECLNFTSVENDDLYSFLLIKSFLKLKAFTTTYLQSLVDGDSQRQLNQSVVNLRERGGGLS